MNISIIGAGNVGRGLGARWERAGHDVTYVGRDDAISAETQVVLLAIPGPVVGAVATQRAVELAGRTVIDATNALPQGAVTRASEVASAAPDARLVKAFNTFFAALYDQVDAAPGAADMVYCGDDPLALEQVHSLIVDAGFRPTHAGGLDAAPDLEGFARLVIRRAYELGQGPFGYRFAPPADLSS